MKAEAFLGARLETFQPTGQATLDLTTLVRGEQELANGVKVVADADTRTIRVSDFAGTVLGSPVAGVATIPMQWLRGGTSPGGNGSVEPATFSLRSTVAVAPMLAALMDQPPSDLTGTLNLTVDGTASAPRLDSVQARVQEQGGALTVGNMKLNTQRTTALRFENGLLHVDAFEWTGPQSTIVASGSVGVLEGASGRLHLDGTSSMALLNLLIPARVSGRSTFDVDVTGPRGARELQGKIAIEDGSMVVQPWRLALADWSGSLVIDPTGIAVQGLHGQFNGGEATIEGRLPAGRFAASGDALAITLRSAFLELPRGLRSQLDADLSWSRAASGTRLSGSATVTARAYREPVTELARLASVLIDGSGRSPMELPALLGSTTLDVQLGTIGPLSMVNSVARVEFQPELQLTGTLAKPALNGQVAVADDGRITVSGRQYRLRDSRVEFSPERGMMPRLDVTGNTRVGDYTVYLRLTGPANEIETSLISDPPLGERDLQTLLVTGQRETLSGRQRFRSGRRRRGVGRRAGLRRAVPRLRLGGGRHHRRSRAGVERRGSGAAPHGLEAARQPVRVGAVGQPRRQRADVGDHLSAAARIRVPRHLARRQRVHGRVPPGDPVRARECRHRASRPGAGWNAIGSSASP